MDRIWLQSYPPGVPAEIDPSQLRSLKELLEKSCAEHAERVAFVQMDTALTYRRLDELSRAFAAWLQHAGFAKGDRFAIMSGRINAANTFNTASFSRIDLFIVAARYLLHNSRHLNYLCQLVIYQA